MTTETARDGLNDARWKALEEVVAYGDVRQAGLPSLPTLALVERAIAAFALVVLEEALGGEVMGKEDWHTGHESASCPLKRLAELRARIRWVIWEPA